MEVHMPSSRKNSKKIKIKKTFEGHFPGLLWHILLGAMEASFHEWRDRTSWLWGKIKKEVSLTRLVLDSEVRIVVLIFLNLAVLAWVINQRFIIVSFPYSYASGEAETASPPPINPATPQDLAGMTRIDLEKKNDNSENQKEEGRAIITDLNKLISSQDERCQKDKDSKECTNLCVENEKEIIAQMKEEERQAWTKYLASHPKLAPRSTGWVSCAEKNDGDPSKSDTKGKHMDEDCCPDPDEWPKPGCRYSAHGLALMLKGPAKK